MVITGRRELAGRHCITFRIVPIQPDHTTTKRRAITKSESTSPRHISENHILARFFHKHYANLLLHPLGRAIVVALFIAYLIVASIGCTQVQIGLRAIDLMPSASPGQQALIRMDDEFKGSLTQIMQQIMVNRLRHQSSFGAAKFESIRLTNGTGSID